MVIGFMFLIHMFPRLMGKKTSADSFVDGCVRFDWEEFRIVVVVVVQQGGGA